MGNRGVAVWNYEFQKNVRAFPEHDQGGEMCTALLQRAPDRSHEASDPRPSHKVTVPLSAGKITPELSQTEFYSCS